MTSKPCACGCDEPVRGRGRYATDACRARAWREKNDVQLVYRRRHDPRTRKPRAAIEVYLDDFGPNGERTTALVRKEQAAWRRLEGRG